MESLNDGAQTERTIRKLEMKWARGIEPLGSSCLMTWGRGLVLSIKDESKGSVM